MPRQSLETGDRVNTNDRFRGGQFSRRDCAQRRTAMPEAQFAERPRILFKTREGRRRIEP